MKLALVTSWLVFAAATVWAAPMPIELGAPTAGTPTNYDARRPDGSCAALLGSGSPCLVARQDTQESSSSSTSQAPASTTTSSFSSTFTSVTSTNMILSSTSQTTLSLTTSHSLDGNRIEAQSNPSPSSNQSNDQLRTVGIIGGLLAGIALVAIIGIIVILVRRYQCRGSLASSSIRSRTRSTTRPAPFEVRNLGSPIMRPPMLHIDTGGPLTAPSMTTAGTLGHHGGMHPFPSGERPPSPSTSYGHHSVSSGHENIPRRAPQIPSLGLSQPRPLLHSFGSTTFSYHASTGHPSLAAQDEQEDTQTTAPPPSTTVAVTEEVDRTEETGRTMPIEEPSETLATDKSE